MGNHASTPKHLHPESYILGECISLPSDYESKPAETTVRQAALLQIQLCSCCGSFAQTALSAGVALPWRSEATS